METFIQRLGKWILPADPFFRLLVVNGSTGVLIAALVLLGIFYTNIGNLRVLVQADSSPLVPVFMLAAGLVITLVSVVIGSAIMLLGGTGDGGARGLKIPLNGPRQPALVPVRVQAGRRRPS